MTMDYAGRDPKNSVTDAEGVMFAANPVWDRANRKRRGFGAGRRNAEPAAAAPTATVAPEPRTFASEPDMVLDRPVNRPVQRPLPTDTYVSTPAATAAERAVDEEPGLVAPISRASNRSVRAQSSSKMGPGIAAAGVAAVVAVGAAGWWATRDTGGVPELTPSSTTTEVAAAPLAPAAIPNAPPAEAVNPPPAAAPAPTRLAQAEPARAERRAPAVRTRPAAAAPSADSAAVNTSATLPAGPQPYTALNPGAATTPAPTVAEPQTLTLPPAQAAPIPSTPPTAPEPAPQTTTPDPVPAAPDTTTPPQ